MSSLASPVDGLVTVRYANKTAAVFASMSEALLQAAHDRSYPGHVDPAYIVDGDHSQVHVTWPERPFGPAMIVAEEQEVRVLANPADMLDLNCKCLLCQFHAGSQGKNIMERNALWLHLFGFRPQDGGPPSDPMAPLGGASVPSGGFGITSTAVALSASTAKTMIGVTAGANVPPSYIELGASGDATSGNLLVEVVHGTGAGAGTATAFTPVQTRGPSQTILSTCDISYTAEPTVLTVTRRWRYPWPGGPFVLQFPLGREANAVITSSTVGKFLGIRATSTVAVTNSDWYVEIEE
jgi:hypothetical protein